MKVLSAEVKTIYTIAVTADDFAAAKNEWLHNLGYNLMFPKAFEQGDNNLGHMSILQQMENNLFAHGDRAGCLAHYLGFDGWENAGIFDEKTHSIRMIVYRFGDSLQKGR